MGTSDGGKSPRLTGASPSSLIPCRSLRCRLGWENRVRWHHSIHLPQSSGILPSSRGPSVSRPLPALSCREDLFNPFQENASPGKWVCGMGGEEGVGVCVCAPFPPSNLSVLLALGVQCNQMLAGGSVQAEAHLKIKSGTRNSPFFS